jgi:predicted kinase
MNQLIFRTYIGLHGSGKTSDATSWVAEDPAHRCRISRDDTRTMAHGGHLGTRNQEEIVTRLRNAMIRTMLMGNTSIVVDETNLRWQHLDRLRVIAARFAARFEVVSYLDVPMDICIQRDANRPDPVGEHVIQRMWHNAVRCMVDVWQETIADNLIKTHPSDRVHQMISIAKADPSHQDAGLVVGEALRLTQKNAAQYAPQP